MKTEGKHWDITLGGRLRHREKSVWLTYGAVRAGSGAGAVGLVADHTLSTVGLPSGVSIGALGTRHTCVDALIQVLSRNTGSYTARGDTQWGHTLSG